MKIKSLWGEMFCQFLFVGYKEIYWILPVCHISWCPVMRGHSGNPYFSPHMWEFYGSKVWSINQPFLFIHICIHKKHSFAYGYTGDLNFFPFCYRDIHSSVYCFMRLLRKNPSIVFETVVKNFMGKEDAKSFSLHLLHKMQYSKPLKILIIPVSFLQSYFHGNHLLNLYHCLLFSPPHLGFICISSKIVAKVSSVLLFITSNGFCSSFSCLTFLWW